MILCFRAYIRTPVFLLCVDASVPAQVCLLLHSCKKRESEIEEIESKEWKRKNLLVWEHMFSFYSNTFG